MNHFNRFALCCVSVTLSAMTACAAPDPAPAPTTIPTEPPTSIPATRLPPTLSPDAEPGLSNLRFAVQQDLTEVSGDDTIFDAGVPTVWVAVDYRDLPPNTELIWRIEGGAFVDALKKQSLTATSGTQVYDVFGGEQAALPGKYRITVRTNKQVLTAAFSISVDRLEPGAVIISDQFEDARLGWYLLSSRASSAEIVDGRLKLTVNWKNQHVETSSPLLLSDFDVSFDMAYEKGTADGLAMIRFRQDYVLNLPADGSVIVVRSAGRDGTILLKILPEPSFQPQGVNKVKIVAHGKDLEFYRNDVLLGSLSEQEAEAGSIELGAWTLTEGGLIISFDNLVVRTPIQTPQ